VRTVAISVGFIVYEFKTKGKAITVTIYLMRHRPQTHRQY